MLDTNVQCGVVGPNASNASRTQFTEYFATSMTASNRSPSRCERFIFSLQNIGVQGPANGIETFKLIYTIGVKFKVFWKNSMLHTSELVHVASQFLL